jgi:glycosyltransferase involved in cell wall biosynthesis
MKKILIIQSTMELGGAESSLLGLLDALDRKKFDVSLFLYSHEGELLPYINPEIHFLPEIREYKELLLPVEKNFRDGFWKIGVARCFAKLRSWASKGPLHMSHNYKQYFHKLCMPYLPAIPGNYDLAISFNDPHYIIGMKATARIKMAWFHTDASRIDYCDDIEKEMWGMSDYVVNVSKSCKKAFDEKHPYLSNRSIVIENILSSTFVKKQSEAMNVSGEMDVDGSCVKILSIGRFTFQKRFDEVPELTKLIRDSGINVNWYLIGYGGDEALIRQKIKEAGMQEYVIILGKKENPYPYIKACDIYIQPSRYEGKSVAVREAQILNKPVIITNYATASNQLEDGIDGVIVPMDTEACAKGIMEVIRDKNLQQRLIDNTKKKDYTNAHEVKKIYQLMETI